MNHVDNYNHAGLQSMGILYAHLVSLTAQVGIILSEKQHFIHNVTH